MRSIRSRLILATAAGMAGILVVSAVALYASVEKSLLREFDNALQAQARGLASMTEQKGSRVQMEYDAVQMPEFMRRKDPEYFQVWSSDGGVIAKSPSLGERELGFSGPPTGVTAAFESLPDGRPGRVLALAFQPRAEDEDRAPAGGPPVVLAVARETESLERSLGKFKGLLVVVCGAATAACAALTVWVVGNGLRPLGSLASQIGGVGDGNLSARVALPDAPAEIEPVVHRLNELLERIEGAFSREKSFSADVAHELRTPLAGLQTTLQVGMSRPRSAEEYAQVLSRSLRIARQLHVMVDTLLMLARVESEQSVVESDDVDVRQVLDECWAPLAGRAAERGLTVTWAVDEGRLRTDREKLRLVLRNLLDNAVTYADANGWVRVGAERVGGRTTLRIVNSGSHLSQDEAGRVFDRFWRGDVARSDTGTHCGLGLTLCKRIADVLKGSLSVRSERGGEFAIELVLPGAEGVVGEPAPDAKAAVGV
jgi:two-component system sensor histidine kinase QseC